MAKAIVATAYGGPEVLSLVDVDPGVPGEGQVCIATRAAGVNPFDFKRYRGDYGKNPDQLPIRLGAEVSGVVRQVGGGRATTEALDGPVSVGDEVIAYPVAGGYATELVTSASNVVHKPGNLSFGQASGLMLTGATAVHALDVTKPGSGETLLVHGASGAVGLMVVQLSVATGTRVIGTASEKYHEQLRKFGAEPVAYGDGLLQRLRAIAPDGVDASIDIAGTQEAVEATVALVHERGRAVAVVNSQWARQAGIKAIGAGPGADPGTEVRSAARTRLAQLAGQGEIEVVMGATFPLAEAGRAHAALAAGQVHGKIALIP